MEILLFKKKREYTSPAGKTASAAVCYAKVN